MTKSLTTKGIDVEKAHSDRTRLLIEKEIEVVQSKSDDGLIHAEAVLEYAKDPKTILHSQFEWDDSKAAHLLRLAQAKNLIRVAVRVLPEKSNKLMPVAVKAIPASLKNTIVTPAAREKFTTSVELREIEDGKKQLLAFLEIFSHVHYFDLVLMKIKEFKAEGYLKPRR